MSDIKKVKREIFLKFVYRGDIAGLSVINAIKEIDRLESCNSLAEYIRISRVGASFPMNRAMRVSVWTSWENAENHAGYAILNVKGEK
jgi:hypothetical protein